MRAHLSGAITAALTEALEDGVLDVPVPGHVDAQPARHARQGDYTSPVTLQLARSPSDAMRLGDAVAQRLARDPAIAGVSVAPPGFLNITLAPSALGEIATQVAREGEAFGRTRRLAGRRVRLCSPAHPRRPRAAVSRGAVAGEVVGRLLENAGATVLSQQDPASAHLCLVVRCGPEHVPREPDGEPVEVLNVAPARAGGGLPDVPADAMRYAMLRKPLGQYVSLHAAGTADDGAQALLVVQYAGARAAALLRHASALGMEHTDDASNESWEPCERRLLVQLAEFGPVLDLATTRREPRLLPRYLEGVAAMLDRFCSTSRILPRGDEPATSSMAARLTLCSAARVPLTNGLRMLGLPAPDRM